MFVFPQDTETPDLDDSVPKEEKTEEKTVVRGLIATAETLMSNGIILAYNLAFSNLVGNAGWATPTAEDIKENFYLPWQWEINDGFMVNQIGHPIQGSMSFITGRVNSFGFYESTFFSLLGSSTWESICEGDHASINDLITTVTGSTTIGEVLYRMYLEACAAGIPVPLAALINPMAGFHRLVTGWEPPNNGRNIYFLQYRLGMGFAQTRYSLLNLSEKMFSFDGLFSNVGIYIIYGNPFEQNSSTPFEQFELAISFGLDLGNYIDICLITDGYLFSFSPVYTDTDRMSTGLSLNMDFVSLGKFDMYYSTINQFSNALDWTIKYQHLFPRDIVFQIKLHAGLTFMGASKYYSPEWGKEVNNYGGGLNSKLFLALENKKLGKLETNLFCYALWPFPGTSALTQGNIFWLFAEFTYSHFITKYISLGVSDSFALERGTFSGFPNVRKYNNAINLYVALNF